MVRSLGFLSGVLAVLAGAVGIGCGSGDGKGCQPFATECRGTGTMAQCLADGSGWETEECAPGSACVATECAPIACPGSPCPDGLVCLDGACGEPVCTPGTRRCTARSHQVEVCNQDGSGWDAPTNCPSGQTCEDSECRDVVCGKGEVRCSADGLFVEDCNEAGTGWVASRCFGANVCEFGACKDVACEPGTARCRPDNRSIEQCSPRGTAWIDSSTCGEGQACNEAECVPVVCTANAWTCAGDFRSRRQCNASGTAELPPEDCEAGSACRDGECRYVICTPGSATCTTDGSGLTTCDATGTRYQARTDCDADQACSKGACIPAVSVLGEVLRVRQADGSVSLSPGMYAVAVVDAGGGHDGIEYPLRMSGYVKDPPYSLETIAMPLAPPSLPRLRCGTPALTRNLPAPRRVVRPIVRTLRQETVGDTRTFKVASDDGYSVRLRTGLLRLQGAHANFWEDVTGGPAGGTLGEGALQRIGDRLDNGVFAREEALYGRPTDVDGNGRIDVFFTSLLPSDNAAAFVWPVTLFPEGSLPYDCDHGEIVYSMRPSGQYSDADMASLIAHEAAHLIVGGRRIEPWLSHIQDLPRWVLEGDIYLGEGLSELASAWSGQAQVMDTAYYALQYPEAWCINSLFFDSYYVDDMMGFLHYGLGALVMEYLFRQAGSVTVTGAATFEDLGGLPYLESVVQRQSGFPRIVPPDGREAIDWYSDMATALLVHTLPHGAGPVAAADPRFRFPSATYDSWFGGYDGLPIRMSGDSMLQRVPWSSRSDPMYAGGASFTTLLIFGEATATVTRDTATATFIRFRP